MTTTFNELEIARRAFEETWPRLVLAVDNAKALESEVARKPGLREQDPRIDIQLRWLEVFGSEIASVQAVYDALEVGARLTSEEIRAARITAEKLLDLLHQADIPVPPPFSATTGSSLAS